MGFSDILAKAVLSTSSDAIIAADKEGIIRFWNPGAERIFGYGRDAAIGQSLDIIIPERLRKRHWDGYHHVIRSGESRYGHGDVLAVPGMKQDGAGVSIEDGAAAARGCAVNLLAQVKAALGDLDKVVRVVRLGGFINSAPDFLDGPKVLNGASDLMVAAFGDKGRHARTTVGVASLPADAAVEVDGVFEVA